MKIKVQSKSCVNNNIQTSCNDVKSEKLKACKAIESAIDILGGIAKDDIIAKESIANLGVISLDLRS